MDHFATAPLIAAAGNLLLAVFVLLQGPGLRLNRAFFLFGFSVAIWTFGAFMMFHVTSAQEALFWTRILHVGVIFLPISLFEMAMLIARSSLVRFTPWLYALGVAFVLSNTTSYFIRDVRDVGYGYFGVAGPLYWAFSFTIPSLSIPSVLTLLKRRNTATGAQRHRLTLLAWAVLLLFLFGLHDVGPMFGVYHYPGTQIPVYPLGTAIAVIYGGLAAYAVLQHQLLDVRLGLGRVAATFTRLLFFCAIGFLFVFTLAILFPHAFTPYSLWIFLGVLFASGVISTVLFPRLLGGTTESLERRILGDRFEFRDKVDAFIEQLPRYRAIDPLVDDLVALFSGTLKVSRFQITFYTPATNEVSYCRVVPDSITPKTPPPDYNGPLARLANEHPERAWFDYSDLAQLEEEAPAVAQAMRETYAELAPLFGFPLRSGDDLTGLLVVGAKADRSYYTALDMDVIAQLCSNVSTVLDQIRLKNQIELTGQLESLAVMSRGLAHDLNNLLTPINTYVQLIGSAPRAEDPDGELLQIVTKNLSAIRTYVREAAFFSTTLAPKFTEVFIEALLQELSAVCRHQLVKRNIRLVFDVHEPFTFHADAILLQRLLANLVFNAIDASPDQSVITIRAVQLPRLVGKPGWVRFQVIDQGSGISRENLGRVFAPYFTTKDVGDHNRGFGLGLTICQKIVHLHHGTITLQSTEGQGTTVHIDLPSEPIPSNAVP